MIIETVVCDKCGRSIPDKEFFSVESMSINYKDSMGYYHFMNESNYCSVDCFSQALNYYVSPKLWNND